MILSCVVIIVIFPPIDYRYNYVEMQGGEEGPQGGLPQIEDDGEEDQASEEDVSPAADEPNSVRTEFPETWIWTSTQIGYMCSIIWSTKTNSTDCLIEK